MWQPPETWRWIVDDARCGAWHMAIDHVLAERCDKPVFRVYDWAPSTVSLGFHQKADRIDWSKLTDAGLGLCRRPTGGRAVVHDRVVTYSATIPLDANGEPTMWDFYRWIGEVWMKTLLSMGVNAEMVEVPLSGPGSRFSGCFASGNKYELTVGGRKIIGSAQRRYPNSALQHGSLRLAVPRASAVELFLERNRNEPDESDVATSLYEEGLLEVDFTEVTGYLKRAIIDSGIVLEDSELTSVELADSKNLREQYDIRTLEVTV